MSFSLLRVTALTIAISTGLLVPGLVRGEEKSDAMKTAISHLDAAVEELLADPNLAMVIAGLKEKYSRSPLLLAIRIQRVDIVAELLAAGARVKEPLEDETPLTAAVINCGGEMVSLLLDKGADPNQVTGPDDFPALFHSVLMKTTALTRLLVSRGADVKHAGPNGRTPLHVVASMTDDEETARFLLEKGAVLGAKDKDGKTAFDLAVAAKHDKVAKVLQPPK